MKHDIGGVWPVMLTPFTDDNKVDFVALEELTNWYIEQGSSGLFAVCQSSEMVYMTLDERIKVATAVMKAAAGRVPVIASGHISDSFDDQVEELCEIAKTGVEAVILVTNRLAKEDEGEDIWIDNLKKLLQKIPSDIKLGFYECPVPYKRVLGKKEMEFCVETGRFYFLKDTSCDIDNIRMKLEVCSNSNLKLYNANTTTLLDSMKLGAIGYSGVMANMHPRPYVWLCDNYNDKRAQELSDALTLMSFIERQLYPVNAKYYLSKSGLKITENCRVKDKNLFTDTMRAEVDGLKRLDAKLAKDFGLN